MPGPLANWQSFDHDTLGWPQLSEHTGEGDGGPVVFRQTFGGPARGQMQKKVSGQIWNLLWLFTQSQFSTFETFFESTLAKGTIPFQMQFNEGDSEPWKACMFTDEYEASPVTGTDWLVRTTVYSGYFPYWLMTADLTEGYPAGGPTGGTPERQAFQIPTELFLGPRTPGSLEEDTALDSYVPTLTPAAPNDTQSPLSPLSTDIIYQADAWNTAGN